MLPGGGTGAEEGGPRTDVDAVCIAPIGFAQMYTSMQARKGAREETMVVVHSASPLLGP